MRDWTSRSSRMGQKLFQLRGSTRCALVTMHLPADFNRRERIKIPSNIEVKGNSPLWFNRSSRFVNSRKTFSISWQKAIYIYINYIDAWQIYPIHSLNIFIPIVAHPSSCSSFFSPLGYNNCNPDKQFILCRTRNFEEISITKNLSL